MSFTRAKPAGWTDNVDALTAQQLNHIDANITRALDGTGGGTYSLSAPLTIAGAAGVSVTTSNTLSVAGTIAVLGTETVTNTITLSGNRAAIRWRYYAGPDASTTLQGAAYDVIAVPFNLTADRAWTIAASSPVPATGQVVRIVRSDVEMAIAAPTPAPSAFKCEIDFGGAVTFDFRPSKNAYLELMWDGANWVPTAWSPTTIDLALAIEDSWS